MVRKQCTRKQYLAGASWPRRTNLRDRREGIITSLPALYKEIVFRFLVLHALRICLRAHVTEVHTQI